MGPRASQDLRSPSPIMAPGRAYENLWEFSSKSSIIALVNANQTANQKIQINSKIIFKNPMSPEPFDSRAKAPPAKRWEKGYEDENKIEAGHTRLS